MKLVIIESPNKRSFIKKTLGTGYEVLASFGHVRDLPPKDIGIDIKASFKPKYVQLKKNSNPMAKIKQAVALAEVIYLATDPDREGEAIAWHIYESLPARDRKKCHRITFNEVTESAIKQAISNTSAIDLNLVNSQQARRIFDRLAGFEVSPMLWAKIKGKIGLSAGRVQSAVLKLLYDRKQEFNSLFRRSTTLSTGALNETTLFLRDS